MMRWGKPVEKLSVEAAKEKHSLPVLEIVKLAVSMLTPILIFVLGWIVTEQNRKSEKAQQEATEQRDRLAKKDADDRAAQLRQETARRDKEIRDENFRHAKELKEAEFAQELRLRNDAVSRENALRAETERAARLAALYAKRTEFWDKFRPAIAEVVHAMEGLQDSTGTDEAKARFTSAHDKLDEANALLETYSLYIEADSFRASISIFQTLIDYIDHAPDNIDRSRNIEWVKGNIRREYTLLLRDGGRLISSSAVSFNRIEHVTKVPAPR